LRESKSVDGTKKYLFQTAEGALIESAYIPDGERATLCVSSQAGCRMGCRFCATARQGLQHSLSTADILNQIISLPECDSLTNLVFMGMGEPLDNMENLLPALEILTSEWGFGWSPTRITVSTAGVAKNLPEFLDKSKVHLAVSLHNPFHDERAEIMPIERAYPIAEVAEILRRYDFSHQRRVSFEYIVMSGLNDSPRHIKELCRLLNGIKCRINLIRFHKIPDSPYFSPAQPKMEQFRDTLTARGIMTTIRASRGEDIEAACGLLSTKAKG
jgi:23S rRNA (adenine2503-C2)-methyltransferase